MLDKKIQTILGELSTSLIERDDALRLLLLATLSGEHILFFGPPGTAKSELARRINLAIGDGHYFERLLTRFSVPEELFGPLSIKALEQDQYTRLTSNYLPDATIAFIDEIFKANSAILNTLLTLLNEREFDNGDQRIKTPLISVIAASNELPENEELDALYDRFLLRFHIDPVSEAGFEALVNIDENAECTVENPITIHEIETIKSHASSIKLSENVVYMLKNLRQYLNEKSLYVSDRRWRKAIKMLKTSALTNKRDTVSIWDCWLLQHCLWNTPDQKELIFEWYKQHIGTNKTIDMSRINKLVNVWQETLEQEKNGFTPVYNKRGEKTYIKPDGKTTTNSGHEIFADRDGKPLYLSPIDTDDSLERNNNGNGLTKEELEKDYFDDYYQQRHIDGKWVNIKDYTANPENRYKIHYQYDLIQESAKFTQEHVDNRCGELSTLLTDIKNHHFQIELMLTRLSSVLSHHLWIDADFYSTAKSVLEENLSSLDSVSEKILEIHNKFETLPIAE